MYIPYIRSVDFFDQPEAHNCFKKNFCFYLVYEQKKSTENGEEKKHEINLNTFQDDDGAFFLFSTLDSIRVYKKK